MSGSAGAWQRFRHAPLPLRVLVEATIAMLLAIALGGWYDDSPSKASASKGGSRTTVPPTASSSTVPPTVASTVAIPTTTTSLPPNTPLFGPYDVSGSTMTQTAGALLDYVTVACLDTIKARLGTSRTVYLDPHFGEAGVIVPDVVLRDAQGRPWTLNGCPGALTTVASPDAWLLDPATLTPHPDGYHGTFTRVAEVPTACDNPPSQVWLRDPHDPGAGVYSAATGGRLLCNANGAGG